MYVKVCGVTRLEDVEAALAAGADAIGVNLVPGTRRYVEPDVALPLLRAVTGRALSVLVVAQRELSELFELLDRLDPDQLQLHGDEPAAWLEALGARAFKALRIGDDADVELARTFPGHPLLVDAKVDNVLGGSGHRVDWSLVAPLARTRPLVLAGGLTPDNVTQAVRAVSPWAVDVASGVEADGDARRKDPDKLRRFFSAARAASHEIRETFTDVTWKTALREPRP
jgi:phosphoribosylanthranilate isomerase